MSIGYPVNVGFYRLHIDFSVASDYYDCCLDEAVFEIKPKPVSVKWTKTTIDAGDHLIEKIPGYRIEGLVASDVIGGIPVVDLMLTFKTAEGVDCLLPTKSGEYIATASGVKYAGTLLPCLNYVLDGNYETSYVILDTKTIGKVVLNDKGGTLSIGTINKSSIEDVTMEIPTVDEALALFEYLKNSGDPELINLESRIQNELNNGGNVNLYITANDVENPERLNLPDGKTVDNLILLDVKLYLCLDNDPTKYVIEDTGNYFVKVNFIIDEIQANDIELASNRNSFVARYHNSKNPGNITQVYPIVRGDIGRRTYEFQFKSNKFSEFALYTQKKPTINYTSHVVPNTKSNKPK